MPAGNYTIQVLGSEDSLTTLNRLDVVNSTVTPYMYGNLGLPFNLRVTVSYMLDNNNYPLYQAGAYDKINNMVPLALNNSYNAIQDTFGCSNAVLPTAFGCAADYKKAMYREFVLSDSMVVTFGNLTPSFIDSNMFQYYRYQLYKGDANALALAQNMWTNPNTFSGLNAISNCFAAPENNNQIIRTCLIPGTYTFSTYGNKSFVNRTDKPSFTTSTYTTLHYSQATVGNLGSVLDSIAASSGNTYSSPLDYFSCRNNAITIAGVAPCNGATKAIYREFYLNQASAVNITSNNIFSLFTGRLSTVGFAGLVPYISCTAGVYQPACSPASQIFPAGWYTIVSYGSGPSYDAPGPNGSIVSGQLGYGSIVHISITPGCSPPLYNRPYKAAVSPITNAPFLVQWNAASAATAYPQSSATVALSTERWNCATDTPFTSHPIVSCNAYETKVAYYVFQLTQESFLDINIVGATSFKLYKRDVRVDSMLFPSLTPIVPCSYSAYGQQICRAQPGLYTLVVFGNATCTNITPNIYIDQAAYSRFDHAKNAYDFGVVPATGTYYNGKVGDVNPLNAGRAASNDFFYCTTGSRTTDPNQAICVVTTNPAIYNTPDTNNLITTNFSTSRRNLWYTFQVSTPGTIKVKVDNKTPGKMSQYNFAVYRSDVNGNLPFTQVVSTNEVDSTMLQGLTLVAQNGPQTLCEGVNEVTFDVAACNFGTIRYYVLVDNRYVYNSTNEAMRPNHQTEVSVKIDAVPAVSTAHDFYMNVADIGTLGIGTVTGPMDNYVCATANISYPITMPLCAQRTLWYKFTVGSGIVGTAKIRLLINAANYFAGTDDMRMFREIVAGDSTATGLEQVHLSSVPNYQQGCVSPGTYYLVLTGCGMTNQTVRPEVWLEQNVGDYCGAPLVTTINGAGSSSATALIDCHTIGTDYGEMGQTISCPVNGVTEQYKSTWFRIDVNGNDTLDLSIAMTENTNVSASQIHYRMMTGNCSAMQEQSCVPDVLTQNTYQCLVPGQSYFIQVFTPVSYFNNDPAYPTLGTLTLNVSAVNHVDTCQPMNNCLVNANFIPTFNCNVNDSVFFNNYSTYGSAITYLWDFGYNNQTSTAVSPTFMYPAVSTAVTYTVSLRAINTDCIDTSYSVQTITIPARPMVNLGNDTLSCTYGQAFTLHATSYPGSTYLWQNGSTDSVFTANLSGAHTYSVFVTFGGCTDYDAIDIYISPLIAQGPDTMLLCDNQTFVTPDASRTFVGTTYLWNTSATTPTISAATPGVYWADVTLNGCTVRDSFVVQYNLDTFSVL
ncbi:MAG: PKD domain-containing protein, partial [Sphingobacteriales bacterium]